MNLAGACAGGLTVAALLGHLQVRRQLRKVSSVTYLVSLLDTPLPLVRPLAAVHAPRHVTASSAA